MAGNRFARELSDLPVEMKEVPGLQLALARPPVTIRLDPAWLPACARRAADPDTPTTRTYCDEDQADSHFSMKISWSVAYPFCS